MKRIAILALVAIPGGGAPAFAQAAKAARDAGWTSLFTATSSSFATSGSRTS